MYVFMRLFMHVNFYCVSVLCVFACACLYKCVCVCVVHMNDCTSVCVCVCIYVCIGELLCSLVCI